MKTQYVVQKFSEKYGLFYLQFFQLQVLIFQKLWMDFDNLKIQNLISIYIL